MKPDRLALLSCSFILSIAVMWWIIMAAIPNLSPNDSASFSWRNLMSWHSLRAGVWVFCIASPALALPLVFRRSARESTRLFLMLIGICLPVLGGSMAGSALAAYMFIPGMPFAAFSLIDAILTGIPHSG